MLWLGNVAQNVTEGQLKRPFHPFGYVTRVVIDHQTWQALLSFDSVDAAAAAFDSMRNRFVLGRKILVSLNFIIVVEYYLEALVSEKFEPHYILALHNESNLHPQPVVIAKNLKKGALGTTTPIIWVWPSNNHAHIFKDGNMII